MSTDWHAVGERTLAQLPNHEYDVFVDWLCNDADLARIYETSQGVEALRLWETSPVRSRHNEMRLPEGF